MRLARMLFLALPSALVACTDCPSGDPDCDAADPSEAADGSDGGGGDGGDGADGADGTGGTPGFSEHCGVITTDEVWRPDANPHRLTCDVEIDGGSLTIEAGSVVQIDEGFGILVGELEQASSFFVNGTADSPVVFGPLDPDGLPGSWNGLRLAENTAEASIRGAIVRNGGKRSNGAISLVLSGDVTVELQDVTIEGSAGCGVELRSGKGLAGTSSGLQVSGTERAPACARAYNAHTLPGPDAGSSYQSDEVGYIEVSQSDVTESVTWEDLGLPYGVLDGLVVGRPTDPAVLTVLAGTTIAVDEDEGIELSTNGDASGFVAEGTSDAPVVLTALGAREPGAWVGIIAMRGVDPDQFVLRHTKIEYAGRRRAALMVQDATVLADHLTVQHSYTAGIGLQRTARFHDDSQNVVSLQHYQTPLYLDADAVGSIPFGGLLLDSDDDVYDVVRVTGDNQIYRSATWRKLDLDYFVADSIDVDGSSAAPAVLTLEPGVTLRMDASTIFAVGRTAQAGVVFGGADCATSSDDPVVIRGGASSAPGAWLGVHFYAFLDESLSCLGNFEVWGGGGTGSVRVTGTSPLRQDLTLRRVAINDTPTDKCPVWVNTYGEATILDSTTNHTLGWEGPGDLDCVTPD